MPGGRRQASILKASFVIEAVKNTKLTKSALISANPWLNIIESSVFSVSSVAKNRSKTLILKNNINMTTFNQVLTP